ncbi:tRNA-uridine aminocarboxypropyltransferase [Grimontia hollisae]|uniref:tRNA-uridine aminocarboxypropyltransferase n=1 Tax=Grimontia hollisae CIP 101886 TaxID=675812 RepID=D0I4B5_GRIHO|nr:DTW domain-containing protein [Grimontia hollisae]EEY73893.1 hypothetical protein VHA_000580 [Grimontia hollisae CIP 101886]STO41844.1 Uncharacterized conserved protein [Grimontia hollisae]
MEKDSRMPEKAAPCTGCGFHYHCFCGEEPTLNSQVRIELLMHETETGRTTNTGQLLEKALPYCRRHIWQRKAPPAALLTLFADSATQTYLVFPGDHAIALDNALAQHTSKPETNPIHFIILDATWQQARKMLRQSPWLQTAPMIKLPEGLSTRYTLRRNQPNGSLCTCEVGTVLLTAMGETDNAAAVDKYFEKFIQIFEADRHHQPLQKR